VFDVFVTRGDLRELAVEVEALYGTGTALHKVVETAREAGGRGCGSPC
jgi:hypothetical protein